MPVIFAITRMCSIRSANLRGSMRLLFAWGLFLARPVAAAEDGGSNLAVSGAMIALGVALVILVVVLRRVQRALARKSAALEQSEQHILLMGNQLPSVIIFQLASSPDHTFHFNYLSKGLEQTINIDREEIVSDAKTAFDHIYESDIKVLQDALKAGEDHLAAAELEIRILDLSGNLRWLRVNAVPHRENGGLVWDGFVHDVSERKSIESELIDEKLNFENLFETMDGFLVICGLNGKLLHTNPAINQQMGYMEEELEQMSLFDLYSENQRGHVSEMISQLKKNESISCELPLQCKGEGSISVEMNLFKGRWRNEEAIFGIARDIESRCRAEDALRESQKMLQLIMDTIPMPVFWVDEDSNYLGCNRAFSKECSAGTPEEIIGRSPVDVLRAETAVKQVASDQQVINTNQPIVNKLDEYTRADGRVGWREISKIPLRNDDGNAVGALAVWRDVTEQNRAEDRLKQTLEDMERFNQLMRGRERRTLQLKAEVNELLQELERPNKYRTTAAGDGS